MSEFEPKPQVTHEQITDLQNQLNMLKQELASLKDGVLSATSLEEAQTFASSPTIEAIEPTEPVLAEPATQEYATVYTEKPKRSKTRAVVIGAMLLGALGAASAVAQSSNKDKAPTNADTAAATTPTLKSPEQNNDNNDAKDKAPSKLTWKVSGSVDKAVIRMKSNNDTELKKNAGLAIDAPAKKTSNIKGMMSRLKSYTAESVSKSDIIEAAAFSSKAQSSYRTGTYNSFMGRDAMAHTEATTEQQLSKIKHVLTNKDTKIENARLSGLVANHGIRNNTLFEQPLQANNIRVVKVTQPNGTVTYFKIGGGNDSSQEPCVNILQPIKNVETKTTPPAPTTATAKDKGTTTPPEDEFVPKKKPTKTQERDTKPKPPKKEKQKEEPTKTKDEDTPVSPPKAPEKHDDGHTPGNDNVPADQDNGTPDKPGTAPATPGTSPADVPRQPQEPTPQPQKPSSETQNRPPASEGTGPETTDPKGSANVPGTNNETPKGGSVDPNNS